MTECRTKTQTRRHILCDREQVERVHVKHVLQRVLRVRIHIGHVGRARRLVQEKVLFNQRLELRLHLGDLGLGELEFVQRHLGRLEHAQKGELLGQQKEQRAAATADAARRAADAVNVLFRVVRRVELDDPVDLGDVEAARRHVRAHHDAVLAVDKLEEGRGALVLLLLAVQLEHGNVDIVEQLRVELHGVARREEDNHLLLQVLLQKREEQQKALRRRAHDIALLEARARRELLLVVDADKERFAAQHDARNVLDVLGLRGREEHRLPLLGQQPHDGAQLVLESDLENAVGLVNHEALQILEHETLGVLQVIEQAAGRADENVDALDEAVGLGATIGAAHHETVRLVVVLAQLLQHAVDLQTQLARRRDDDHTGAVALLEVHLGQQLDRRDEKGDRLARAGLGRAEHVAAREQVRNAARLHLGHALKLELGGQRLLGLGRQLERVPRLIDLVQLEIGQVFKVAVATKINLLVLLLARARLLELGRRRHVVARRAIAGRRRRFVLVLVLFVLFFLFLVFILLLVVVLVVVFAVSSAGGGRFGRLGLVGLLALNLGGNLSLRDKRQGLLVHLRRGSGHSGSSGRRLGCT